MPDGNFSTLSKWVTPITRRKEVDLRLVPLAFFALIVIGTVLLWSPWTHRAGQNVGLLDSFFLATSATCVTGLSTVNVAETFNTFGQGVLLFLIQAGGLGIFTASISLVLLSGQKLSLVDEHTIRATMGRLQKVRPLDVFIYGCIFVLLIELAGAIALFYRITEALPDQSPWRTGWEAVFHSVSAFCNAGISIYPDGLAGWRTHADLLGIINVLVILGGIGLMALINLRYFYFWRRDPRRRGQLTLQTKLALATAGILLVLGTLAVLLFETGYTLAEAKGWDSVSWAFFHSTMTRTAGFNVVDIGAMNPPTLLCTLGSDVRGRRARLDGRRHQDHHVRHPDVDRVERVAPPRKHPGVRAAHLAATCEHCGDVDLAGLCRPDDRRRAADDHRTRATFRRNLATLARPCLRSRVRLRHRRPQHGRHSAFDQPRQNHHHPAHVHWPRRPVDAFHLPRAGAAPLALADAQRRRRLG
jgi:hypothetical protein